MGSLDERVPALAAAQLSMLVSTGAIRTERSEFEVPYEGTPIYDLEGYVLFERARLDDRTSVDLAVAPELGAPVVAIVSGESWNPDALVEQAAAALGKYDPRASYDETRLVAYSLPKLAVQFLEGGREVALIECYTGAPIPEESRDDNFRRIPFRAELDEGLARRRAETFAEMLDVVPEDLRRVDRWTNVVRSDLEWVSVLAPRTQARDLHFSGRNSDHEVCFELRGQETNVWCVGASVQMVLDFYRYPYTQDRLATELGLGTKANPNGLPYSRDADVVMVLENMTGKSLNATMNSSPTFKEYKAEILANRPLISFVPGHSRSVAGFTETVSIFSGLNFRGLVVFDPWPPNAGVITRFENFTATTYRRTFTAKVTLA